MNTGIGDAINLAWKLKAVLQATPPTACSTATKPSACPSPARLVDTTDRAFSFVSRRRPGFAELRAHPHRAAVRQRGLQRARGARVHVPHWSRSAC
jgi:2-polyprenyl-6-methoxyphenol hydroxylase-like FAD-dependent oxidoreductase